MDVHSFINTLREESRNNSLIQDIKDSIKSVKCDGDDKIKLEVPPEPADFKLRLRAKCIHGNMFEDQVLKASLEDGRKVILVKDADEKSVKKQMSERKSDFKEIYQDNPKKKYELSMKNAGTIAWKILANISRTGNLSKKSTDVRFEEWIKNKVSSVLMGSLRADFVSRTADKTIIVDLKFSTMKQKSYEDQYLIDGIVQVLIYSLLMGVDPELVTLGVLVYYGKEGKVVLYTTDKRQDAQCMKKLMRVAGISRLLIEPGAKELVPAPVIKKQAKPKVRAPPPPTKEMEKLNLTKLKRRPLKQRSPRGTKAAEFSDVDEDDSSELRTGLNWIDLRPFTAKVLLFIVVLVFVGLITWIL